MVTAFEDLRILQSAEGCADSIWKQVVQWDKFARDGVGKQMARAIDSIGANVAESFGRFNVDERRQFRYYAHGNFFETIYWLNRAKTRDLMRSSDVQESTARSTDVAKQLNSFAESLKSRRSGTKKIRQLAAEDRVDLPDGLPEALFDESDLEWLQS